MSRNATVSIAAMPVNDPPTAKTLNITVPATNATGVVISLDAFDVDEADPTAKTYDPSFSDSFFSKVGERHTALTPRHLEIDTRRPRTLDTLETSALLTNSH